MKKFLQFLPLLITVFTTIYSVYDDSIAQYLAAHPHFDMFLLGAFAVSEALAALDFVKANSVVEAVLEALHTILSRILDKPAS